MHLHDYFLQPACSGPSQSGSNYWNDNITLSVMSCIDRGARLVHSRRMRLRFRQARHGRLETEASDGGYPPEVAKAFRKRIAMIRAADDERVFRGLKSLNYKKLAGNRQHQLQMRLNGTWRLILEYETSDDTRVLCVVDIEDEH